MTFIKVSWLFCDRCNPMRWCGGVGFHAGTVKAALAKGWTRTKHWGSGGGTVPQSHFCPSCSKAGKKKPCSPAAYS